MQLSKEVRHGQVAEELREAETVIQVLAMKEEKGMFGAGPGNHRDQRPGFRSWPRQRAEEHLLLSFSCSSVISHPGLALAKLQEVS